MSSLSSVLFKGAKDADLDGIFSSSAGSSKSLIAARPTAEDIPKTDVQHKTKLTAPAKSSTVRDRQESDSDEDEDVRPVKRRKQTSQSTKSRAKAHSPSPLSRAATNQTLHPRRTNESSDDDESYSRIQHIAISGEDKAVPKRKKSFAPVDETDQQRDARTVFVGNLPIEAAKSKLARKQLSRHLLASIDNAKVDSVRFRSVAFQNPTASLKEGEEEAAVRLVAKKPAHKGDDDLSTKERRQKDRADNWRHKQDDTTANEKKFLSPAEKRRIAFIHKEFHEDATSVTAYTIAKQVVKLCNDTIFMDRTIRVDHVGEQRHAETDPKRSIFVGSLDFAAKDEDLRVFFESLLSTERGPAEDKTWVTQVRIVRDANTQLGKGFAYVEFADRECVDEVLALEEPRLKFAKRKLRVQRCKSRVTAGAGLKVSGPDAGEKQHRTTPKAAPPKSVVEHEARAKVLAELTKDERKASKAADISRAARRLAKKKARNELTRQQNKGDGNDSRGKDILGKKRSNAKMHKGTKTPGGKSRSGPKPSGKR
ncbi:hypothetical protein BKA62DRAFT_685413 [Auriculariales sp. MPI-PUGE-AT-0066]|nr:hypothetical protein BKA62DRAFT_685413 [Auriculariales sp. MPI-PUGE-AT-0066]